MATCVFFEESGGLKAASVLSETDSSLQVELGTGRRVKVKASHIILRFESTDAAASLAEAQQLAQSLDADFLWSCAPPGEFSAVDFSKEVFGDRPRPPEQIGLVLALSAAPIYFSKRGKGVFRAAPEDQVKAALAGQERRRLAAQEQAHLEGELLANRIPESMRGQALSMLVRPDRQSIAWKALESAAHQKKLSPERLLLDIGAIPSAYALHRARFIRDCLPEGLEAKWTDEERDACRHLHSSLLATLPLAASEAYSLDDDSTTEVDDAFSLEPMHGGGVRVGIHIAAPGLLIAPGSRLATMARERASTIYFPGEKITMLPHELIELASLNEGQEVPALSLYCEFDAAGAMVRHVSRVEKVRVARNIRHGAWEDAFANWLGDSGLQSRDVSLPWQGLLTLHRLALGLRTRREEARGRPEPTGRVDFTVGVQWAEEALAREEGRGVPTLGLRQRGSPVDLLVSEFMILTNVTWGETLALGQLPGIYRCQSMGRVRMQTSPGPHQGLGVSHYAWSSSPLRRYADLVNQWQLLSVLGHGEPAFRSGDAQLLSDVAHFDGAYDQYANFQSAMERYWSLRWLGLQMGLSSESWSAPDEGVALVEEAVALRTEGSFRLRRAPVVFRLSEFGGVGAGTVVEVSCLAADALEISLAARGVRVLNERSIDKYAVLGQPISHSRSPMIHASFAEQLGEELTYEALEVSAEALLPELNRLKALGYKGLNLTVPLKEHAYQLALEQGWPLTGRARAAQAVNTLRAEEEGWSADNTDGLGLVRDLERALAGGLQGRSVLLIGAGGAAQGVIGPLLESGVTSILLANRTLERAERIADRFEPSRVRAVALSSLLEDKTAEGDPWPRLVVNASSASLQGEALAAHPSIFSHAELVLDMMYGAKPSAFMQQAMSHGATHCLDGLGMLVEQAAEAYSVWRGRRPQTEPVLRRCREMLSEETG